MLGDFIWWLFLKFFFFFLEERSAVGLSMICFPFAWQVGETKPYGKNVKSVWHLHLFTGQGNWLEGKTKIRKRSKESGVYKWCIITREFVWKYKAAVGTFVCHGMWTNHSPGCRYLFAFQIPRVHGLLGLERYEGFAAIWSTYILPLSLSHTHAGIHL